MSEEKSAERSEGERVTPSGKVPNKSIAKNSIFYLIYNVLNVVFPFVTGIYVARVLLSDSIGQVAYAQNIAQYFVILAFLGIPTYGLREISKARGNQEELNKVHSELFFLNLISTVLFVGIYLTLIFTVGGFRENISLYLIVGLSIALNALNNSWLYEGLEEFKTITIRNLVFKAVAFVLLVVLVRGPSDVYYYALVTVVGVAGNNLFNIIYSRKFVRFRVKGLNLLRHLKPVLLLVVVNLAIEIYTLIDTTMLGIFCSKEVVAYYTYGNKINKILLQIINTFTVVVVPRLSLYYKEGKSTEFTALLTNTLKIILMLAIPIIVGVQFVSQFLICKMYGDEYLHSAYVLQILSAVLLFSPIGYLLGSRVLLAAGKEWKMAISVGIGAVVNVIGNYFLIQYYNEYGAAIASIISEIVVMIVYICMAAKYFKLNRFWDTLLKVVLASAVTGGYLFGCSYIPLNGWAVFCIQFFGAVAVYFALLLLFREKALLQALKKLKSKLYKSKTKEVATNMKELTLQEIQQNSFQVLLKFKQICDENNLTYFLAYGTLLGAVRHEGFIPWDDDIDVWMPRPDYEKFVAYCIEHADALGPFVLKHYKTCKEYIYPIARLVDSRYKIEYTNAKDYGLGLFIDIYPLDGVNEKDKKHLDKLEFNMRKITMLGTGGYIRSKSKLKNLVKYPYYLLCKGQSLTKLIQKSDLLAQKYSYENSDTVGCIVWGIGEGRCRAKSDFAECVELPFNGGSFKVPVGYDRQLKMLYGDYMQLPPESERIAHHFYSAYKISDDTASDAADDV